MNKLGEFIEAERTQRDMSIRQFADLVKYSHVSIGNYISEDPPEASLEFLIKLAAATHYDLCTLIAMVRPDVTPHNAQILSIADRIARLSPDKLERLDNELIGIALKSNKDNK